MLLKTTSKVKVFFRVLLFVSVLAFLRFSILPSFFPVKIKNGLLFADYIPQQRDKITDGVIISSDGEKFIEYKNEKYSRTTHKYYSYESDYEDEIEKLEKENNLYQTRPVFFDDRSKTLLLLDEVKISYDLWKLNVITGESGRLINKIPNYCNEILNWYPEKNEIYAAKVEDIGSVLFVEEFCKIDTQSGKIIKKKSVPRETISLYPYYLEKEFNRLIVDDKLIDLNKFTIDKLQVYDWKNFDVFSYEFVDGKIIFARGLGENDFALYDIKNNSYSDILTLEKKESGYDFVDISPDHRFALMSYFVRYADGGWRDGGNGYSCYLLVDLNTFKKTDICSDKFVENARKKQFFGWIIN